MSKLLKITEKNYSELTSMQQRIYDKLSYIDSVLDVFLVQREKAKIRKNVLGEDVDWAYSYLASEVHYTQNKRRYWFKKYQTLSMGLSSFELEQALLQENNK